jgi:hypothetical protein
MLGDVYRWKSGGILSVMIQDVPSGIQKSSELRLVDLSFQFE